MNYRYNNYDIIDLKLKIIFYVLIRSVNIMFINRELDIIFAILQQKINNFATTKLHYGCQIQSNRWGACSKSWTQNVFAKKIIDCINL